MNRFHTTCLLCALALLAAACSPESARTRFSNDPSKRESDAKYVGQAVGNFEADEWYPGGR